jgi:hypothetical protein
MRIRTSSLWLDLIENNQCFNIPMIHFARELTSGSLSFVAACRAGNTCPLYFPKLINAVMAFWR